LVSPQSLLGKAIASKKTGENLDIPSRKGIKKLL